MRRIKQITLALLVLLLLPVCIDRWIVLSAQSKIFTDTATVSSAQAILVPGARIYGGKVSGILAERLDAAIALHQAEKADRILVSGDYSGPYYDEATAMKKYLLLHGIASGSILLDHAGFSTYDSVFRAKHVFGLQSVIIVSQDFHLPRSLFIARGLGLQAFGFSASQAPLSPEQELRSRWREPLARLKAVWDVANHVPPAFTGSGLPLDSRGTLLRW